MGGNSNAKAKSIYGYLMESHRAKGMKGTKPEKPHIPPKVVKVVCNCLNCKIVRGEKV